MNAHSVEKIGGTSIAATDVVLANVLIGPRSEDALYGRVFVVSAFAGITNLLLEHKKSGAPGVYTLFANAERASRGAWREGLEKALSALRNLNEKTFSDPALRGEADALAAARIEEAGARLGDLERLCGHGHFRLDQHLGAAREMLASIGEAHSALVLTLLLRARGVTARFVDLTGWDDSRLLSLDERIAEAFAPIDPARELPIVTGYAKCSDGLIAAYGRGYTEVVFARVAAITGAAAAIIHKEFHLSSADPLLVGAEAVRKIGKTNYDVADQLANIGMEAVHPRAARSLRHARIPLQVRNTFDPSDAGTVISADFVSAAPRVEIVAGIKNVTALELLEHDMVGVKGYDSAILDALTRHNVRIVSKASNANTITHHVAASP
ncbi:MAG: aspartate kinase, partial [Hyphomonadaceae bacterium]